MITYPHHFMLRYNQFRSKFKGSGLLIDQICRLWDSYKSGDITDENLTKTNIKKLILSSPKKKVIRRVSLIKKTKAHTNINVDLLSRQPPEIVRKILLDMSEDEIMSMCHLNKRFASKVCTNYFWKIYITKKWGNSVNNTFLNAVNTNNLNKIKILLKGSNIKTEILNKALVVASKKGYVHIVNSLLGDKRVDPGVYDNKVLIQASEDGHVEIVKILLQHSKVDPSDQNNRAILTASQNGDSNIVKELLKDKRVDPGVDENGALIDAIMDGHIKVVKLLINDGRIDPSAYDNSAIKEAIYRNDKKVVSILIKDGGVVVDKSIIKFASLEGSDSMAKYLSDFK